MSIYISITNRLFAEKRARIVGMMVEGMAIRAKSVCQPVFLDALTTRP
jgi:hypothetical protein